MAVEIHLKDKVIYFEDIITLTDEQLLFILERAITKTEKQWLHPETRGIKIRLCPEQKAEIIAYKKRFVDGHTAETLFKQRLIRFTNHGLKRIAARIDKDAFPSERTLLGMANLVIKSDILVDEGEWCGYGSIS